MKTLMKKLKLLYYLVILTAPDLYDNKKLSLECHFSVAAARCSLAVVTGKTVDSHWYPLYQTLHQFKMSEAISQARIRAHAHISVFLSHMN